MLNDLAELCPPNGAGQSALDMWAAEHAARAPRISAADAAPLIVVFRSAVTGLTVPAVAA